MEAWAVVACDQYTAQKDKWEEADRIVKDQPSALRLIIPECYLDESDQRVPQIQQEMEYYLNTGILEDAVHGMVLLCRATQSGSRLGLVMTIDLEHYSFDKEATPLIRPTEGTILSRIPPRQKVRRGAALELAHVMLLCDDPGRTVIEPVYEKRHALRPLYDIDLMLDGGHATGWAIEDEDTLKQIAQALAALQEKLPEKGILLAVGDGNHSLATAKAHWMEVKKTLPESEWENHPARFATVELNNIYDEALIFEPIHRVIFDSTAQHIRDLLKEADLSLEMNNPDLVLVTASGDLPLKIGHPLHTLPVGTVQTLLDQDDTLNLDYVHGEDAVREIVENENAVGILLPAMDKALLFPAVEKGGPLPRKTFSMGEANEKRYYIEARKIVK
ncbi:MAG: DUF1015 domain-containing protein [Clostridiales bacterium]|nr:DUF1015 domain-containing protein [Clostridiales bacterium]